MRTQGWGPGRTGSGTASGGSSGPGGLKDGHLQSEEKNEEGRVAKG